MNTTNLDTDELIVLVGALGTATPDEIENHLRLVGDLEQVLHNNGYTDIRNDATYGLYEDLRSELESRIEN